MIDPSDQVYIKNDKIIGLIAVFQCTQALDPAFFRCVYRQIIMRGYVAPPPPSDSKIQYSRRDSGIQYSLRGGDEVDLLRSQYLSWEKEQRTRSTFSSLVLNHMAVKMISPSTFCRRAGIDRKLFSKLKTDFCYSPKKDTAIRYCFALQLSLDDANALLKSAGFALSNSSSYDLAIQYCLEHRVHELAAVNMLLEALDEKVFS